MIIGIKISVLGFSQSDERKFKKIFRFSRFRRRFYTYCSKAIENSADILIVNGDTETIEQNKKEILVKCPDIAVVVATKKGSLDRLHYQINGDLFGVKVLKTLDRIDIESSKPKFRRKTKYPVTPRLLNDNKIEEKILHSAVENPENRQPTVNQNPAFDVLVVDDSPSMQKVLELEFAQTSMETRVSTAETGEQALECVAERNYDFIFLDVMMPGIDGYETCSRIRKYPQMKKTPIIMLSAKNSPLDEVRGIMAGCTTYLTKPIKHEEFQKVVGRILRWLDEYKTLEQPCGAISK